MDVDADVLATADSVVAHDRVGARVDGHPGSLVSLDLVSLEGAAGAAGDEQPGIVPVADPVAAHHRLGVVLCGDSGA